MIDEKFVLLAVLLNLIGTCSYLLAMLQGKAKPNRVSWFLWGLVPMIAFFAQISKGVGLLSLPTFMFGAGPLLIFGVSFISKKSEWKITKFDLVCGAFSLVAIVLWIVTQEPNLAILFSIIADFAAAIPTLVKSIKYPETEDYMAYLLAFFSACITLLAIKNWSFEYSAFPLYIFFIAMIFVFLIRFKVGKVYLKLFSF